MLQSIKPVLTKCRLVMLQATYFKIAFHNDLFMHSEPPSTGTRHQTRWITRKKSWRGKKTFVYSHENVASSSLQARGSIWLLGQCPCRAVRNTVCKLLLKALLQLVCLCHAGTDSLCAYTLGDWDTEWLWKLEFRAFPSRHYPKEYLTTLDK